MVRALAQEAERKKVNTLLIIDVHARDIIDTFVRESILHDEREFAWESQLRFYWDRDEDRQLCHPAVHGGLPTTATSTRASTAASSSRRSPTGAT